MIKSKFKTIYKTKNRKMIDKKKESYKTFKAKLSLDCGKIKYSSYGVNMFLLRHFSVDT